MIVPSPTTGAELFAARRDALFALARQRALGAVVVFGHGSALGAGTASHGALRFLSGWDSRESPSLLVITPDRTHLLVGSPFMLPLARQLRRDLVIHDVRPDGWGAVLATLLPSGEAVGTIGFAEMPLRIHDAMVGVRPGRDPSLDLELSRLRLLKDEVQLRRHRAAAALCDELFAALGKELSNRRPAWQIQLDLETQARRNGAEYCRTWLTIAPEADYCRYWREETERIPEPGDQVLLGVALTLDGHWGHGIRMGSIGPQKPEHAALAAQVEAMLVAGMAALRPGLPLAGVEAAMEARLRDGALLAAHPDMVRFRGGHGLGFSYEEPLLTEAFRQHFDRAAPPATDHGIELAGGMLFELHPNIFLPGLGGAALGEMVLVTPEGPECLLRFPRACAVWP